ncbi:vacuolar protein sorting-associated protein 41 homolog isoform X2 [Tripterygium wilfordii]|uniref:vacuolar protein sorting-associated protein 41 homolog isoform X2 n=1 Tax=Tripterygium wilfordii TaxID=458696 RepID=UPI0018F849F0|nr:vacuolar protein sorting-associated protein 41 homolog isoform X2 [Tripterygium wilfordii]
MPSDNPRLRDTSYEVLGQRCVCKWWMYVCVCMHMKMYHYTIHVFYFHFLMKANGVPLFVVKQVAFVALATDPSLHKDLLSTVKSWPPVIYSAFPVISAIEPQLNTSSMTDSLKEALSELYVIDGQYGKLFRSSLMEVFDADPFSPTDEARYL